jgi:hypothetical protein
MPKTSRKAESPYSVHPGVLMVQKWIVDLPDKTGKSLDQWLKLVRKSGPPTEQARREWLKTEHGLGTNVGVWIAERAEERTLKTPTPMHI